MPCVFCSIAAGEIPAAQVYEDERILAFRDIAPQAAVHVVVIPKSHIASVDDITDETSSVAAHIFERVGAIARAAGATNGYRVITNVGSDGRQSVPHLHFHILGGEKLPKKIK